MKQARARGGSSVCLLELLLLLSVSPSHSSSQLHYWPRACEGSLHTSADLRGRMMRPRAAAPKRISNARPGVWLGARQLALLWLHIWHCGPASTSNPPLCCLSSRVPRRAPPNARLDAACASTYLPPSIGLQCHRCRASLSDTKVNASSAVSHVNGRPVIPAVTGRVTPRRIICAPGKLASM